MRTTLLLVVMAFATLLPPPCSAAAADTQVMIRTYDMTAALDSDRAAALAVAAAILEDAGLAVDWLACETVLAQMADHPCMAPLRADELAVRLVRLPAFASAHRIALGYSLVETEARFGSLATVYVDRVSALATASAVDEPTLLGRAVAHEIGHLLLGTTAHARAGVMRAVWSPEILRRSRPGDWLFSPDDAGALRAAVRTRTAR